MPVTLNGTNGLLHEFFEYKNGNLYWKKNKGIAKAGDKAGTKAGKYLLIKFCGKNIPVSRVVFYLLNGYMPEIVDHINGDTMDNRIENLRAANSAQNNYNRSISTRNKSGVKGASFCKQMKKWKAQITVNYKQIHLGYFDLLNDAEKVIEEMRQKLHGNFAHSGVR